MDPPSGAGPTWTPQQAANSSARPVDADAEDRSASGSAKSTAIRIGRMALLDAPTLGASLPDAPKADIQAASVRVEASLDRIRRRNRDRTLDAGFSVALRERWQTWTRRGTTKGQHSAEVGSEGHRASDDGQTDDEGGDSGSEADRASTSRGPEAASEDAVRHPPKGGKGKARSSTGKGTATAPDWDVVRREREERLQEMDERLPRAFRFKQDQTSAFARRQETKYLNMLERPFGVDEIRRILDGDILSQHSASHPPPAEADEVSRATPRPLVLEFSFFFSQPRIDYDDVPTSSGGDEGFRRANYQTRPKGDGPGGMHRSQTVELLSTHTVRDLANSLLCWSDDTPERLGWRRRLAASVVGEGTSEQPTDLDGSASVDKDGQDPALSRFTGRKRDSDFAVLVEEVLFGGGKRAGDESWEADYATLLHPLFTGEDGGEKELGDADRTFDKLQMRMGQPYWLMHQGDCVHSFTLDSIRALRPEEDVGRSLRRSSALLPTATSFPRVTWLSPRALFRFITDGKETVGVGQRILNAAGHATFAYGSTSAAGVRGAEHSRAKAWSSFGPERRKVDSALRLRMGRCSACQTAKASVGIVGGEQMRVRAPPPDQEGEEEEDEVAEGETVLSGMDEQVVSLCASCATLLGIARRSPLVPSASTATAGDTEAGRSGTSKRPAPSSSDADPPGQRTRIDMDWSLPQRGGGADADAEGHQQPSWTMFPL